MTNSQRGCKLYPGFRDWPESGRCVGRDAPQYFTLQVAQKKAGAALGPIFRGSRNGIYSPPVFTFLCSSFRLGRL